MKLRFPSLCFPFSGRLPLYNDIIWVKLDNKKQCMLRAHWGETHQGGEEGEGGQEQEGEFQEELEQKQEESYQVQFALPGAPHGEPVQSVHLPGDSQSLCCYRCGEEGNLLQCNRSVCTNPSVWAKMPGPWASRCVPGMCALQRTVRHEIR